MMYGGFVTAFLMILGAHANFWMDAVQDIWPDSNAVAKVPTIVGESRKQLQLCL